MDEPVFFLSMQIDGQTFSAQGPKAHVLALYEEWKALAGFTDDAQTNQTVRPFNGPRMVQH